LRLKGVERGFNDTAQKRNIVIHKAWYVNKKMAKYLNWVGRSLGCFVVPSKDAKRIIDTIKGGTALYAYYPLKKYLQTSHFLDFKKADLFYKKMFISVKIASH